MLITRIRPSIWVSWESLRSERSLMPRLLDTHDGIDLELSHHVPRVEQKLFDPLRHPILRRVVRGVLLSRHPGEPKPGNVIPQCGDKDVQLPDVVRYWKLVQQGRAGKEILHIPCESSSIRLCNDLRVCYSFRQLAP
jgi:hypothetical protein